MRITIDKLSSTLISFKYFVIKVQTWTGVITIFKIQGSNLGLVRLSSIPLQCYKIKPALAPSEDSRDKYRL